MTVIELQIVVADCDIEDKASAVDVLAQHCDMSRSRLKYVMQCGAVWLTRREQTRRLRRAKAPLNSGDTLFMYYDADLIDSSIPEASLLADKGEYSVWFKPSGMLTQGTKWGDHHTIGRWAEQHLQPQRVAKIVHRLDRHTSGVILVAHSKTAANNLSSLFRQREIDKRYYAIVAGEFSPVGVKTRLDSPVDDKPALSYVTTLEVEHGYSLLEVKIETGRKHQVRRHLCEVGYPIIGDKIFGEAHDLGLQLCAAELSFKCPISSKPVVYKTPEAWLPDIASLVATSQL